MVHLYLVFNVELLLQPLNTLEVRPSSPPFSICTGYTVSCYTVSFLQVTRRAGLVSRLLRNYTTLLWGFNIPQHHSSSLNISGRLVVLPDQGSTVASTVLNTVFTPLFLQYRCITLFSLRLYVDTAVNPYSPFGHIPLFPYPQ